MKNKDKILLPSIIANQDRVVLTVDQTNIYGIQSGSIHMR